MEVFSVHIFLGPFIHFKMARLVEDIKNINYSKDLWYVKVMANKEHLVMVVIDLKVSCNYPLQFEFLKSISSLFKQYFGSS